MRYTVFASDEAHLDRLLKILADMNIVPTQIWRNLLSFELTSMTPELVEILSYNLADIEED